MKNMSYQHLKVGIFSFCLLFTTLLTAVPSTSSTTQTNTISPDLSALLEATVMKYKQAIDDDSNAMANLDSTIQNLEKRKGDIYTGQNQDVETRIKAATTALTALINNSYNNNTQKIFANSIENPDLSAELNSINALLKQKYLVHQLSVDYANEQTKIDDILKNDGTPTKTQEASLTAAKNAFMLASQNYSQLDKTLDTTLDKKISSEFINLYDTQIAIAENKLKVLEPQVAKAKVIAESIQALQDTFSKLTPIDLKTEHKNAVLKSSTLELQTSFNEFQTEFNNVVSDYLKEVLKNSTDANPTVITNFENMAEEMKSLQDSLNNPKSTGFGEMISSFFKKLGISIIKFENVFKTTSNAEKDLSQQMQSMLTDSRAIYEASQKLLQAQSESNAISYGPVRTSLMAALSAHLDYLDVIHSSNQELLKTEYRNDTIFTVPWYETLFKEANDGLEPPIIGEVPTTNQLDNMLQLQKRNYYDIQESYAKNYSDLTTKAQKEIWEQLAPVLEAINTNLDSPSSELVNQKIALERKLRETGMHKLNIGQLESSYNLLHNNYDILQKVNQLYNASITSDNYASNNRLISEVLSAVSMGRLIEPSILKTSETFSALNDFKAQIESYNSQVSAKQGTPPPVLDYSPPEMEYTFSDINNMSIEINKSIIHISPPTIEPSVPIEPSPPTPDPEPIEDISEALNLSGNLLHQKDSQAPQSAPMDFVDAQ